MQENILDLYNKILQYTIDLKAAIEEKKWERVNLLASYREKLFQQTNAFVHNKSNYDEDLKQQIHQKLLEIKKIDDENLELINNSRDDIKKAKAKVNIGHKAIGAYMKLPSSGRGVDRTT